MVAVIKKHANTFFSKGRKYWYAPLSVAFCFMLLVAWLLWQDTQARYENLLSTVIYDRHQLPVSIAPNSKSHYVHETAELPEDFIELLLKKEDQWFYYHPGINPISTLRAVQRKVTTGEAGGSSTLTQQLAKNILANETDRTIINKLVELLYTFSIELFASKEEILHMYANTVYLGNQTQGFATASYAYFDKPLAFTTHSEQIALLATLSRPSTRNPWESDNQIHATNLSSQIAPEETFIAPNITDTYSFQQDTHFELRTSGIGCDETCNTTVDSKLTDNIRNILNRHVLAGIDRNIRNGAVVIIDPKNHKLLALVGSRDPNSSVGGNQINMALEPRPIGSTIKPFIYAKGFELGLRPYTVVEDREYKYPIATGFSLYPKNYDGQYYGNVTLHEALSNSLNVPSVKTLEFIGLNNFYSFLSDDLQFQPIQDYDSYQYGIALGGLEMDLLTLTHYFTLFPNQGTLSPLQVLENGIENFNLPPQSTIEDSVRVFEPEYTELVHQIISDRFTGVNQFGLEGNLNISHDDYGVKTGTSRDYHDSWVIGYTGDFVVGVWLGNSENEALDQVSGSSGAGAVWHDVMEYLLSTDYNENTQVSGDLLQRLYIDSDVEWGLGSDVIPHHQNLLMSDALILSIHPDDTFELTSNMIIPLRAREEVVWNVNGQPHDTATESSFAPESTGSYEITATAQNGQREIITIEIIQP